MDIVVLITGILAIWIASACVGGVFIGRTISIRDNSPK